MLELVEVGEQHLIGEVIGLLLDHKIGALPVVDEGTREVVGIISYVDVLRALQGLLEEE